MATAQDQDDQLERDIVSLTEQLGGTLITDQNFAVKTVEPLFAVAPIDQATMNSEEVMTRLLARFRPSEVDQLLEHDPGFVEWKRRGLYNKSSVGFIGKSHAHALAAYLEEFMWLETRVPDPKRSGTVRPPFHCDAVIGLSPQGYAAALDPSGGLWYACLSDENVPDLADDELRSKLWVRHPHCFLLEGRYKPSLRNIEHDVVTLIYDAPLPLCLVVPLKNRPGETLPPPPTSIVFDRFGASRQVDYAVATDQYAILLDSQGAVGIYSVTQERLLTQSFITLGPGAGEKKLRKQPPPLSSIVNPLSGSVLEEPPKLEATAPAVGSENYPIIWAFFNELEPNSFILCAEQGSMFLCQLPVEDIPLDRDLDLATELKMRKHDIIFEAELKEARGDAPISDLPVREPVRCACYRSKRCETTELFGDDADDDKEKEEPHGFLDEVIAHGGEHALLAAANQLDYQIDNPQSMDLFQQASPECMGYNCVAVLGTAVVAHEMGGGLFVFSMLQHRAPNSAMPDMCAYMPMVPVESGYRSLYVTAAQIFCLLPDGRLFCAV